MTDQEIDQIEEPESQAERLGGQKYLLTRILSNIEFWIGSTIFVLTVSLLAAQVFYRKVLGTPLDWSEELARFSLVWLTFVAAAYVMSHNAHIHVDILVAKLSAPMRKVVDLFTLITVLITSIYMVYAAFQFVTVTMKLLSPAAGIPMGFVYSAALVGFSLIAIHAALELLALFGKKPEVTKA